MVRERVLEGKHSMVPWIFCVDGRAKRGCDHKIRSLAGSSGFRSSEACSVDSATGLPVGIYNYHRICLSAPSNQHEVPHPNAN